RRQGQPGAGKAHGKAAACGPERCLRRCRDNLTAEDSARFRQGGGSHRRADCDNTRKRAGRRAGRGKCAVRYLPAVLLSVSVRGGAGAGEVRRAYTACVAERGSISSDRDEGEDWADLFCSGYKGYPVLLYYGDARECAFSGFPLQE